MRHLTFVTSNDNKLREAEAILGMKLRQIKIELDEIQEMDLAEIIERKARQAYRQLRCSVIVEDAGLYVDAWNGFPGPFIKWLQDTMGYPRFTRSLGVDRRATWAVAYGFYDGKTFRIAMGKVVGRIATAKRGVSGWGFDPYFIPRGSSLTYAEMGAEKKQKCSARRLALLKLRRLLRTSRQGD